MGKTRTHIAAGIVLDAGALIALDRGDKRMLALLHEALAQGRTLRVLSGVVGQAWRDGRSVMGATATALFARRAPT